MPAVPRTRLTELLLQAFESCGISVNLTSSPTTNPRKLVVETPDSAFSLFVYVWTLTFGGRPSLPDEYRIQMTGVSSPLSLNPNGQTILVGYEPNLEMFAGFDVQKHRHFTAGSPSVQINIRTVRKAITDGLAFDRKSNDEIACGIRQDQLLTYVLHSDAIHRYGKALSDYRFLSEAVTGRTPTQQRMKMLSRPRRRIVEQVSRLSRSANFRREILQAYDNRCAITGIQLKLVDAAHILPVGAPGSTDEVTNGIAINPTYHRAYDRGLIYLDEAYTFRVNKKKEIALKTLKLSGGLTDFVAPLGKTIILPTNPGLRPSKECIRKANRFRHIA